MKDIAFNGVSKRFREATAVDNLTFHVAAGSVCGLLGPNGAGKSTAFKCMLGLVRPTAGNVTIGGEATGPAVFGALSYVPERPALHEWLTVEQHFEIVRRTKATYDPKRAAELVDTFKIDRKKLPSRMSKGQQTAVSLALAFATRPEVLVLDEPASGLDPIFQRVVLDLIVDAAASGVTILFSSHQIGQVERAVDQVAILDRGKLVLSGNVDDLKGSQKVVEAIFPADAFRLEQIEADPRVRRVAYAGRIVRVFVKSDPAGVASAMQALGPKTVDVLDLGLEDIFLGAVGAPTSGVL